MHSLSMVYSCHLWAKHPRKKISHEGNSTALSHFFLYPEID